MRAFSSALSTSSLPLTNSDVFVNITGGTPEPLVAAIACGYRTIFHVACSGEEEVMYNLPTEEEQRLNNIDYFGYKSPVPELPTMGVLAAEAVRQITAYLKNECLGVASSIKVPLVQPLNIPPAVTYTYLPVLNQIVKRTVRDTQDTKDDEPARDEPSTPATSKKPGKPKAGLTEAPVAPTPKGQATPTGPKGNEEEGDEDEEEDGEEKPDDELEALNEMEKAAGKKRKAGKQAGGTKKAKA